MELIIAQMAFSLKGVVQLLVALGICGVVLYFIQPYIHPTIMKIMIVIIVIAFCLFLLQWAGLL